MIEKDDIFGYFMEDQAGWNGCPKCKKQTLVNLNFNDKITCIDPQCNWEWIRYK